MTIHTSRPEAPSPLSDHDTYSSVSDETYSVFQNNVIKKPPILPKKTLNRETRPRLGDGINSSSLESILSLSTSSGNSSVSSCNSNSSLKKIIHRKSSYSSTLGKSLYDTQTVKEIKSQFQTQIDLMIKSQERINKCKMGPKDQIESPNVLKKKINIKPTEEEIKELERGKSFLEARTVIQKHMEKVFNGSSGCATEESVNQVNSDLFSYSMISSSHSHSSSSLQSNKEIKHLIRGISHAIPEKNDDIKPSPPNHNGIKEPIQNKLRNTSLENCSKFKRTSKETLPRDKREHNDQTKKNINSIVEASTKVLSKGDSSISSCTSKNIFNSNLTSISQQQFMSDCDTQDISDVVHETLSKEHVKHKIDYLGSLPIASRSTDLSSLQKPLKDLYFKYRALQNLDQSNLPGILEIDDTGLKVQYIRELHKGIREIFNPFHTIAVWAAVKFVHRRNINRSANAHQFAFLPLVSDPESQEKERLFHDLDFNDLKFATDSPHSPLFACVMRRKGVSKQLECHGFICSSSEDAIIIAANLYQALLETMKKQISKKNHCISDTLSSEYSLSHYEDGAIASTQSISTDTEIPLFKFKETVPPDRPPRKNKRSKRISVTPSFRTNKRKSFRGAERRTKATNNVRKSSTLFNISPPKSFNRVETFSKKNVRQSVKNRSKKESKSKSKISGDVYTRVAIPRTQRFINVSSKYNLQELFRELKEKEGVESIDDVLKKVISPNGISFNKIKPVYRELLLKLAMTMSQDELFERSKNIISQGKKSRPVEFNSKKSKNKSKDNSCQSTSTIRSFLKMTFTSSSNKNISLASDKKNKISKSRAIQGYQNIPPHSKVPLPSIPVTGQSPKTISKSDISSPINCYETYKSSELPFNYNDKSLQTETKEISEDTVSECGYEGIEAYDTCSCGINVYTAKPVCLSSEHNESTLERNKATVLEIYSDCDDNSCISNEKCYCSFRKDPREFRIRQNTPLLYQVNYPVTKRQPNLQDNRNDEKTLNNYNPSEMNDSRSVSSKSYSNFSTCIGNGYITVPRNTATDITSYSSIYKNQSTFTNSSEDLNYGFLSECESPQTSFRRINRFYSSQIFDNASKSISNFNLCSNNSYDSYLDFQHGIRNYRNKKNTSGSLPKSMSCNNYNHNYSSYFGDEELKKATSKELALSDNDKTCKVLYNDNSTSSLNDHHLSGSERHYEYLKQSIYKPVLSMKKSSEIAYVFPGAKFNQTIKFVKHNKDVPYNYNEKRSSYKIYKNNQTENSCRRYSKSNMQSTLGYFP